MRALVLVFAVTLACSVGAWAQGASSGFTMGTTTSPTTVVVVSPAVGDEIADRSVASTLGITTTQVMQLRQQGLSYSDIATAQAIASKSGKSLSEVATSFQTSKNWTEVAGKYDVSMADISTAAMMSAAEIDAFYGTFLSRYYGLSQTQITSLRQQGLSWDEITMIANTAARTRQPVQTIASQRAQGMTWEEIACRYNLTLADITRPATRTVAIRPISGAGPVTSSVMYNSKGNVLLTLDQVQRLYRQGYDWLDVAVAANMSDATDVPVQQFLRWIRQGSLWTTLATRYGVPYSFAFDVSNYPFPRRSIFSPELDQSRQVALQRWQTGEKPEPAALGPLMMTPMVPNYQ